jgi:hypothetical protein
VTGVKLWPSVFHGQCVLDPSESQSNPTQPVLCLMPCIQELEKHLDTSQGYRVFLTTSTQPRKNQWMIVGAVPALTTRSGIVCPSIPSQDITPSSSQNERPIYCPL